MYFSINQNKLWDYIKIAVIKQMDGFILFLHCSFYFSIFSVLYNNNFCKKVNIIHQYN